MATTQDELESFYQFASKQLTSGDANQSLDELYDQWRLASLTSDDVTENVAAIRASIDDMNRGERGRDVRKFIRELRSELEDPATE